VYSRSKIVDIIGCVARLLTINGEIFLSHKICKCRSSSVNSVNKSEAVYCRRVTKTGKLPPARSSAYFSIPVYPASCNIVLESESQIMSMTRVHLIESRPTSSFRHHFLATFPAPTVAV